MGNDAFDAYLAYEDDAHNEAVQLAICISYYAKDILKRVGEVPEGCYTVDYPGDGPELLLMIGSEAHYTNYMIRNTKASVDECVAQARRILHCASAVEEWYHKDAWRQRGRHALQRRQFLESRDVLNDQLVLIIDRIYKEPHEIMDKAKRRLRDEYIPGTPEWDREVSYIVREIANIGDKAQNQRPDNARVRKAGAEQPPESSQVDLDLESRCKWYTGTLHLLVRKTLGCNFMLFTS
eukprot:g22169.t2